MGYEIDGKSKLEMGGGGGVTMFREMSYSPPTPLRNIYPNKNKPL